ncbi:BQ5605_C096g13096 [Microbotryum silenes-dioicae]|uniref:BQ5605_C096g13096 protein n=1 Tax=Microbotryum silenes-dioicae TaxID=796604 RepID=A0A2X0MHD9_9BASI|nr:BQ5605_C096g13096 [Microbotryum silenes-dioicae]
MAPRATEGERAWLDIDSHLIRDESGQWRVRCELCNKHYKLPGGTGQTKPDQECQRPLPEDEIRTDEDQEGSDRLLRWIQKVYRPFLGKRVPDEYWDQLESEHRTRQAALRPFATTVLVHVPEPPKPPTDGDLEPERKKIWDSWIRDAYRWMRKKGYGGEGAASTSGAREEDAISEHSSATGQHSDHGSAAGSEAESNLSTLSELTSLSELERGLDTGT